VAAAILLLTLSVPCSFRPDSARAQGAPQALPVTVAKPLARHVKTWDEYSGRFEAVQRVEL
jgi:hypothetical protein